MRVLARLLLLFGTVWLVLVVLAWLGQERLLYLPGMGGRDWVATPADAGLHYQVLELTAADGVRLRGWWVPHPEPRGALLFFHGNAGNISHRLHTLELFHGQRMSVLMLDYRGYGRSEGRPSEAGTAQDARAAWSWLRQQAEVPAEEIIIAGRSLGAAVAAELASVKAPAGVVLEAPFRSVPLLARELYPFLPVRWLARIDYPVEQLVTRIEAPVRVLHSRDDEIVPFAHGQAVYDRAAHPCGLVPLQGGHNTAFLDSRQLWLEAIDDFLETVLPPARPCRDP